MAEIAMFPEAFIALQEELFNHPDIQEKMRECQELDFPARLAYLAGILEIVVDGWYTYGEIEHLSNILTSKLKEKRTLIVLSNAVPQLQIASEEAVEAVEESAPKIIVTH